MPDTCFATNLQHVKRRIGLIPAIVLSSLLAFSAEAVAAPIDDYNLAVKFFQQKRWDLAEELSREFLESSPDHPKAPFAKLYLGQSLAQQRKYDLARTAFREFAASHPQHKEIPLATYRIGESSYFLGDDASAERELTLFVSRFKSDALAPWAFQYLGETKLRKKQFASAANQFRQTLALTKSTSLIAEATLGLSRALQRSGDLAGAMKGFRALADGNSRRAPEALFAVGSIYYENGDFQQSRETFATFEEQFPGSSLLSTARLNAGFAAYQLGDYTVARKRFQDGINDPALRLQATYWLGLTDHAEAKFERAIAMFREVRAAETDPALENLISISLVAKASFYTGDSHLRLSQFDKALSVLKETAERYPNSEIADDAVHEATEAAARLSDYEAIASLNRVFQQRYASSPLAARQRLLVAQSAIEQVEADPANDVAVQSAEKALGELIRSGSELATRGRLELARLRQMVDEPAKALAAIRPLFNSQDNSPTLQDARLLGASLLLEDGEPVEAARLAERVWKDSNGESSPAKTFLARARADQGQWDRVDELINSLPAGDDRTELLVDIAEAAYAAEAWEPAARWFEIASSATAPPVSAVSGLGYSRFELARYREAADAFAVLEQAAGANRVLASTASWMRGLSLQRANEPSEAQQVFEGGVAAFAADQPQEIEPADSAELTITTNVYQMSKQAARIARENNETARADRYYATSVDALSSLPAERRGDLDKLLNEWALLAYESEQFDRSDELFTRLLRETPNSSFSDDATLYLGESDFFAGRVDKARETFSKLSTSKNADDFVRERASLLLLDIAAEQSDWATLKSAASRFLKEFPQSSSEMYAAFRRGEAELRLNEYSAASESLERARRLAAGRDENVDQWLPTIWVFLAEAEIQQKDYAAVEGISDEFNKRFQDSPFGYQIEEIVGRAFKNRAEFPKARIHFQNVVDSEAGRRTETAAKSQLMIAETYLLEENFKEALKAYYSVYVNYAFNDYRAPALSQAAACDEAMEQWASAAESYRTLIKEFPTTQYAAEAEAKLAAVELRIP